MLNATRRTRESDFIRCRRSTRPSHSPPRETRQNDGSGSVHPLPGKPSIRRPSNAGTAPEPSPARRPRTARFVPPLLSIPAARRPARKDWPCAVAGSPSLSAKRCFSSANSSRPWSALISISLAFLVMRSDWIQSFVRQFSGGKCEGPGELLAHEELPESFLAGEMLELAATRLAFLEEERRDQFRRSRSKCGAGRSAKSWRSSGKS